MALLTPSCIHYHSYGWHSIVVVSLFNSQLSLFLTSN